jgi:hypothetical protein
MNNEKEGNAAEASATSFCHAGTSHTISCVEKEFDSRRSATRLTTCMTLDKS